MKHIKFLLTSCLILLHLSIAYASSIDIRPGEPGSSSSRKATIITSYQSSKIARDSITVILQSQGYKITTYHKTKIKGYKPVSTPLPKCHCDESNSCNSDKTSKRDCSCQSKKSLISIISANRQKTPTITAEIKSSRKQLAVILSTKLKTKRIEPSTDIESITMQIKPKEVTFK